jgi:hypothetical protein
VRLSASAASNDVLKLCSGSVEGTCEARAHIHFTTGAEAEAERLTQPSCCLGAEWASVAQARVLVPAQPEELIGSKAACNTLPVSRNMRQYLWQPADDGLRSQHGCCQDAVDRATP